MRTNALHVTGFLVLVFGCASSAVAANPGRLQKVYFSATRPGAFARYEQTTTDARGKVFVSISTISRLEDEGDRVWLEVHRERKRDGKQKASTVKYLLKEDFNVEKNALDYLDFVDRIIVQDDGGPAREIEKQAFRTLYPAFISKVDYGSQVTSKGTETVDGKSCDRYGLAGKIESRIFFMSIKKKTYEGDLWLNDSVPFGRVEESVVMKDRKGNLVSKSETKLIATGSGATSRIKGPVLSPDPFGGPPG